MPGWQRNRRWARPRSSAWARSGFAKDAQQSVDHFGLIGFGQSNGTRQAEGAAVNVVCHRARGTAGSIMRGRTVNRLPDRASLDFGGGEFAKKLPRVDARFFLVNQDGVHP